MQNPIDCKSCRHATVNYKRDENDRHTTIPNGSVLCSKPSYKRKRGYTRRDAVKACSDYTPRRQPSSDSLTN